jgi:hypothetical protein
MEEIFYTGVAKNELNILIKMDFLKFMQMCLILFLKESWGILKGLGEVKL